MIIFFSESNQRTTTFDMCVIWTTLNMTSMCNSWEKRPSLRYTTYSCLGIYVIAQILLYIWLYYCTITKNEMTKITNSIQKCHLIYTIGADLEH
jgi:hypothetical protein